MRLTARVVAVIAAAAVIGGGITAWVVTDHADRVPRSVGGSTAALAHGSAS